MNIADTIDSIYPASGASGVILSSQIWVIFDKEIDENSVNDGNFFIEGPDTDSVIGPDYGLNLPNTTDSYSGDQFASPNYKGIVPGKVTFEKIQLSEVSAYSGFDTSGSGSIWRTKIVFTPKYRLSASTQYTVYVSGDEDLTDTLSTGIRARSIFDTVNGPNTGTGEVTFKGTFIGSATQDTFRIKITTAGQAGTAKFEWWRLSDPSFIHGPILAERYQKVPLEEGVEVDFGDGTFNVGDYFSVVVKKPELFKGNMYWSFTTGSGSIQAVPTTTSTSIIGDVASTTSSATTFAVSSSSPADKATNQPINTANIAVKFNTNLDGIPGTDIVSEPVNGDDSSVSDITYSGRLVYTKEIIGSNTLSFNLAPNQLFENNLVTVTVSGSAKAINGQTLGSDHTFWFTTKYNPYYSSVRKVRLEIGSFINKVSDDTINLAIYEASLMADGLSFAGSTDQLYLFARREWTTCKAAEMLLMNNLGSGGLKSKRLDNFEVTYDANQGADILKKVQECLLRWEGQLISNGAATQLPQMVVKGDLDVDAPNVGRMWEKGPGASNWPGSNLRYRPVGISRRYLGGWRRKGHGDD